MTSIKFIACVTQNTLFYMLARNILLIRNLGGLKSESEVSQSCPTLRDPMDCNLPGSPVHGIFQARVLEWVTIAFSAKICRERQIQRVIANNYNSSREAGRDAIYTGLHMTTVGES